MTLWLLESIERVDYDETADFVIRASTEARARAVAVQREGPYSETFKDADRVSRTHKFPGNEKLMARWADPARSQCSPIAEDGEEAIILRDFRAG